MTRDAVTHRLVRGSEALTRWIPLLLVGLGALAGPSRATTRIVPTQFATIQSAIDASAAGDSVLLEAGVYSGVGNRDLELRGRDIVVLSREGASATTINCEYAGRGFRVYQHETPAAIIQGITIRNGVATGPPLDTYGGGICALSSSPTIKDCVIQNCQAVSMGRGGGIYLFGCDGLIEGCVIGGNLAAFGGGIYHGFGSAILRDCVITDNFAGEGGGVAFMEIAANTLVNCTISGNAAASRGGGVMGANRVFLFNCIVWGNATWESEGDDLFAGYGGAEFHCTDIDSAGVYENQQNPGSVYYDEHCVFTDPLFCGPSDRTLRADSPCLPEHSPCGELIGALGLGCGAPPPTGACCFLGGLCVPLTEHACGDQEGTYMGDYTDCEPNPCTVTPVERTTWGRIKATFAR
jgi:hypothetical protein